MKFPGIDFESKSKLSVGLVGLGFYDCLNSQCNANHPQSSFLRFASDYETRDSSPLSTIAPGPTKD